MTVNEKIARWLGLELKPYAPQSVRLLPGDLIIDRGNVHGLGIDTIFKVLNASLRPWEYDGNIALWHGKDGLLAKIEKRGPACWYAFIKILIVDMGPRRVIVREDDGSEWVEIGTALMVLESTPTQLASALAKIIDEEFARES